MRKSYIGVTGFMHKHEAVEVLEAMPFGDRLLMIGVLASDKTRQGIPNKYPNRYPKTSEIADIFPSHKLALNVIHYHTKERKNLYGQLAEMTFIGGQNLHGLQLNIAWPNTKELERYRNNFPFMQIILQVGNHALNEINNSPRELSSRIGDYAGLIDYALIDPSGGQGKALDPIQTKDYILALKTRGLRIVVGVAGGLSPQTLHLLEPLAKISSHLCIDAEGQLRDQNDHLNVGLAKEFIKKSLPIFNGNRHLTT